MGAALVIVLIALGSLAAGVLVGRYYVPDDRQLRRSARHGRAYLRALSEALGRDPEAALAELRAVVEENIEDPEPYKRALSLDPGHANARAALERLEARTEDRAYRVRWLVAAGGVLVAMVVALILFVGRRRPRSRRAMRA